MCCWQGLRKLYVGSGIEWQGKMGLDAPNPPSLPGQTAGLLFRSLGPWGRTRAAASCLLLRDCPVCSALPADPSPSAGDTVRTLTIMAVYYRQKTLLSHDVAGHLPTARGFAHIPSALFRHALFPFRRCRRG